MKKILFLIVLMLGLVSCGTPKQITIPNKNLKYENEAITYKGKPYTGKIKMNLSDKVQGFDGFISFKDGHFDGLSEIKNEKQKMNIKFTVVNGKFDGEVVSKMPQMGEANYTFKEGKIVTEKGKLIDGTQTDITYDPEGVNGTMVLNGQTVTFKNGEGEFQGGKLKVEMDYETQKMVIGFYQGDKLIQKVEQPILTVDMFEKMLLPIMAQ